MENKKLTESEKVEVKIKKILMKGYFNQSELNYLANLVGNNTALVLEHICQEIWFLKRELIKKKIIKSGKITFIEGEGWILE